ncbi:hypothetical protein BH09PSE5_BH09PSE5_49310 [soil metagenome]
MNYSKLTTPHLQATRDAYRRALVALCVVLMIVVLFFTATTAMRLADGAASVDNGDTASSTTDLRLVALSDGLDSLGALFAGYQRITQHRGEPVYANTLKVDHCKFQSPPSSLLIFDVFPKYGSAAYKCDGDHESAFDVRRREASIWFGVVQWSAVIGTIAIVVWMLHLALLDGSLARASHIEPWHRAGVAAAATCLCLTFYPLTSALTRGDGIGQVQVLLNLLLAAALLLYMRGKSGWAGALIGLCCVFKPQYAVVLLWGLHRRDWRLSAGLAGVAVAANLLALWRFGLAVHIEYLDFARGLVRHGEAYWANQSVNGILNRLMMTANPLQWATAEFPTVTPPAYAHPSDITFAWDLNGFPPYHPVVYWGTLLSGLAFIVMALRKAPGVRTGANAALDLGFVFMAVTMASPIAWQHHFGAFTAVFALALAAISRSGPKSTAMLWLLGLIYLLMTCTILRADLLVSNRWLGLGASTFWLGAFIFYVVVLKLREGRRAASAVKSPNLRASYQS